MRRGLLLWALAAASVQAQPISLADQRAARLQLAAPPQRIVTLPMPAAAAVVGVDGSPKRLAGMNPASLGAIRGHFLGALFPQLQKVSAHVIRGNEFAPNVEELLALKADLVFQWADRGQDVISPIERAGLKVYGMRYRSQEELEAWLLDLGTLLDQRGKAENLVAYHRKSRAVLEADTAKRPAATRPTVLYFGRFESGLRPAGTESYVDFVIRLAGGRNVAAASGPVNADVNFEQVLAWNPDVVLLGGFDATLPAHLYADPKWRALKAVRERRVYKMPVGGYRWDPPSHESPLGWLWLHQLLYPKAGAAGLRQELRALYQQLYPRLPDDAQIDQILLVAANGASRHYEQFTQR